MRRYQEAGSTWHGAGAPELFHYNLLCVAHCGAAAAYATLAAPENAYFEWKSVLPWREDEVKERLGVEPQGQAQLIVGLLTPATLLDILRDYVVFEPDRGRLVKKLPPLPAVPRRAGNDRPHPVGPQTGGSRRSRLAYAGLRQVVDDAVAGDEAAPGAAPRQSDHRGSDRPDATRPADIHHVRELRVSSPRNRQRVPATCGAC